MTNCNLLPIEIAYPNRALRIVTAGSNLYAIHIAAETAPEHQRFINIYSSPVCSLTSEISNPNKIRGQKSDTSSPVGSTLRSSSLIRDGSKHYRRSSFSDASGLRSHHSSRREVNRGDFTRSAGDMIRGEMFRANEITRADGETERSRMDERLNNHRKIDPTEMLKVKLDKSTELNDSQSDLKPLSTPRSARTVSWATTLHHQSEQPYKEMIESKGQLDLAKILPSLEAYSGSNWVSLLCDHVLSCMSYIGM